jgi:hypothetical protein
MRHLRRRGAGETLATIATESYGEKVTRSDPPIFAAFGIIRPLVDLIGWRRHSTAASKRRRWAMSNVTKFALSAAIILSTAFSGLTAANAGFAREQAVSQGGTGAACYDRDGGIVSCNSR